LSRAVLLHPEDDIAVLVEPVVAGGPIEVVGGNAEMALVAGSALPLGHKVALRLLASCDRVRKYGEVIGRMTAAAAPGEHVHVHNLASLRAAAAS
jgi:altronate dehydratase small subunit